MTITVICAFIWAAWLRLILVRDEKAQMRMVALIGILALVAVAHIVETTA